MLTMATKQEVYELGERGFEPFPAWVEMNPRYACSNYALENLVRAVCVKHCCVDPEEGEPELYTCDGNFELDGYGKSWRLWYANGRERPTGEQPWERFSWDT